MGALARAGHLAERLRLVVARTAEPGSENEPAGAEQVQRDRLPRQLVHPAPGKRRDQRANPHPGGGAGDRGESHPRVGHRSHRRTVSDVVPDEKAVPAPFLGPGSQAGSHPGVSQFPEQPDIDPAPHDGDLNDSPAASRARGGYGPAASS